MDTPLLETRHLDITMGDTRVCRELDWACHRHEIWAVLGRNGAGKTSLLHCLAGLVPGQHGQIRLLGQDLTHWRRPAIARTLGLLLQDYHEPFPATVLDYVLMGRHPHLKALQWESQEDYDRVQHALKAVGLGEFAARDVQTLSGGEFQRMRIAMLLAQDPQILLLDEPVNHLDLQFQHGILSALINTIPGSGKAVVMTLHDVNLAVRYCTHVLLMHEQGRVEAGAIHDILTAEALSALYQYPVKQLSESGTAYFIAG